MEATPIQVRAAVRPLHGEPEAGIASSGEDTWRENGSQDSSLPLPALALESSAFRRTVWAHMDPYKRRRLNVEDFEDRLNVPPLQTTDNVSILARSLWERLDCTTLIRTGTLYTYVMLRLPGCLSQRSSCDRSKVMCKHSSVRQILRL